MDNPIKIILYVAGIAIVCVATILVINLLRMSAVSSSATHNRNARMLRRLARANGWKVLENPTLTTEAGTFSADHLVLCPYGALTVCDLHRKGNYYGDLAGENWTISTGDADKIDFRTTVPSPMGTALTFEKALRKQVERNKIYFTQYECFVGLSKRAFVFITGSQGNVLPTRKLKKALSAKKYQTGKANPEALAALPGLTFGKKK